MVYVIYYIYFYQIFIILFAINGDFLYNIVVNSDICDVVWLEQIVEVWLWLNF